MNWKEQVEAAASEWVDKNGSRWSNNNDEAGDNFGSFTKGANWAKEQLSGKQHGEWQLCPKCNGEGYTSGGLLTTSVFVVCNVCNGAKVIAKPIIQATSLPVAPSLLESYNQWVKQTKRNGGILIGPSIKEFFEWHEKRAALPTDEDDTDLGIYEVFKKLTTHLKGNAVEMSAEELRILNELSSKTLSKTPTRLDDQQVKEEGNPDAQ